MPCSAHRRNTDVVRPGAMADVTRRCGVHGVAYLRQPVSHTPPNARHQLAPAMSTTARRHRRSGGTTPIPVVTANGRPQARNKEGLCGNGLY
jgi:hypothetical protein